MARESQEDSIMEESRPVVLVRAFSTNVERRIAIRRMLGAALGLSLTVGTISEIEAKKKKKSGKKKGKKKTKKKDDKKSDKPGKNDDGPDPGAEELALLGLINEHRSALGVSGLTSQSQLEAAAQSHSQDQATNQFSDHTGTDGKFIDARMKAFGYTPEWWAENIYYGGASASEVFNWWKSSPGHNSNMLSSNYTEIGLGVARSSAGVWYWTAKFADP
jgi:uncharacterized protein YkwD